LRSNIFLDGFTLPPNHILAPIEKTVQFFLFLRPSLCPANFYRRSWLSSLAPEPYQNQTKNKVFVPNSIPPSTDKSTTSRFYLWIFSVESKIGVGFVSSLQYIKSDSADGRRRIPLYYTTL
jgi:hypothetical protein